MSAAKLEAIVVIFDKLVGSLRSINQAAGATDLALDPMMRRLADLSVKTLNLSHTTLKLGEDYKKLEKAAIDYATKFNISMDAAFESVQRMQVGMGKFSGDMETFESLRNRAAERFGKDSAAQADFFKEMSRIAKDYNNTQRESLIMQIDLEERRKRGRGLTQQEMQDLQQLQRYNEGNMFVKLMTGELDAEQAAMQQVMLMQMDERQTKQNEELKAAREVYNFMQEATKVRQDAFALESRGGYMQSLLQTVGSLGAEAGSAFYDVLRASMSKTDEIMAGFEQSQGRGAERKIDEKELAQIHAVIAEKLKGITDEGELNKKMQEEIIALSQNYTEEQMAQIMNDENTKNIRNSILSTSKQYADVQKGITVNLAAFAEHTRSVDANSQKILQATLGIARAYGDMSRYAGLAGAAVEGFDTERQLENLYQSIEGRKEYIRLLEMQKDSFKDEAKNDTEAIRYLTTRYQANEAMLLMQQKYAAQGDKNAEKEVEKLKAQQEQIMTNTTNLQSADKETRQKALEEANKFGTSMKASSADMERQIAEAKAKMRQEEIEGILAIAEAQTRQFQGRQEMLRSEADLLSAQVSLMDSLAVGIGASAEARQAVAMKTMQQAREVSKEIQQLRQMQQDASQRVAEAKTEQEKVTALAAQAELQKRINEKSAEELRLKKDSLDQMQKLREGYLDAIQAMETGAGVFSEIIVSQDKNLGALIRTTGEVPRVLRTGAGSGGLTAATGYGPGGITGGFNPQSPEYGEHVISNFEQINKLVEDLPAQIGKSTAENLAIAAKAHPSHTGVIVGAAAPGSAGTITAPAGGSGGVSAATAGGTTGGSAAVINGVTIDMSQMIQTIAEAIQKAMITAVETGTTHAVKELEKNTA